jgi:Pyruvate/2-oxoacid:ferredoxin oxidoreductase gamma subunit
VLEKPPLEAILSAIREDVPGKVEDNISAAQEAYREVRILGREGLK